MPCCTFLPLLPTQDTLCYLRSCCCRFVPAWGAGNDLLRQVKHVSVNVLLLRCTLGMHMTVSLHTQGTHVALSGLHHNLQACCEGLCLI